MLKIFLEVKKFLGKIRRHIYYFTYKLFKLCPLNKKLIIADNFGGNKYSDNPAAILDKILEIRNDLEIYWVLNKNNYDAKLPKGVKFVKFNSFKHYYLLATARIWIDNTRKPLLIKKRKETYYIQTWHGGFGFKRIEKDIESLLPKEYIKIAKNDSKNISLLITNSIWQIDYFKKCFYFNGEMLATGLPRNDLLLDKTNHDLIKRRVYKELKISRETRLLLYAPTFRDDRQTFCYNIDYNSLINALNKKTDNKWKILLRLHPNISNLNVFDGVNENIINVSNYSSLNDLMIASDMLISDFSSLVFDYSYLSKPIILYASDIDEYTKKRRPLFTFDELPFPYATNNSELENLINGFSEKEYLKGLKKFYKEKGLKEDGHASERIAKIITDKINE